MNEVHGEGGTFYLSERGALRGGEHLFALFAAFGGHGTAEGTHLFYHGAALLHDGVYSAPAELIACGGVVAPPLSL